MQNASFPARAAALLFGVFAYAASFATLLYAVGFIGGFLVPKTVDGPPATSFGTAVLINAALLAAFALQHSVMARPVFKRWLLRFIPAAVERSTYVLASSVALLILFRYWEPMGGTVWTIEQPAVRLLLQVGYALGWLVVLATTFLIHHFDLFGLRQVWLFFHGRTYSGLRFVTPGPYQVVRHPLYVGWLMTFWLTPHMTVAHLFFAIMTTVYILVAIRFEERDLADAHPEYHDYRRRTPMLLPRLRRDDAA